MQPFVFKQNNIDTIHSDPEHRVIFRWEFAMMPTKPLKIKSSTFLELPFVSGSFNSITTSEEHQENRFPAVQCLFS